MLGVMATAQALKIAEQKGLDLVEISPNATPSVCKIMDYGKFRYEESIREKNARKAQKVQQVKEIKFHPGTDTADYEHKLKQIRTFVSAGNKVKLTLQFRGRENAHREIGEDLFQRVLKDLENDVAVEQAPKQVGRALGALVGPRKSKGGARPAAGQREQAAPEAAPADSPAPAIKITIAK